MLNGFTHLCRTPAKCFMCPVFFAVLWFTTSTLREREKNTFMFCFFIFSACVFMCGCEALSVLRGTCFFSPLSLLLLVFHLLVCNYVCIQNVSKDFQVSALTSMESKGGRKKLKTKKSTTQSKKMECACLGITLDYMHEETERGACAVRQMRGWQSAVALCDFGQSLLSLNGVWKAVVLN